MREWAIDALRAFYLFSPLLVAAALSAVVVRWDLAPKTAIPIDLGLSFGGRRLFGDSKTWRGVLTAVVGCVVGAWAQKYVVVDAAATIALLDYRGVHASVLGAAMGAGAMLGELPNSAAKRRLGIPAGGTAAGPLGVVFYVWDQVDLLTVAWPLVSVWVRPSVRLLAASFLVALAVHPIVALVGYALGARRSPR